MPIYVRPFKKEDFKAFEPIEPLPKETDPEFAQAIEDSGLAITGVRDGEIVGSGGCHPVDDFHGELWLRLSKDCLKHRLETINWIRSGLKIIEETFPFKQLDLAVNNCFASSIKMVEYLGFKLTQTKDDWLIYSKRVQ